MSVIEMENQVIQAMLAELSAAGFTFEIDNGEEQVTGLVGVEAAFKQMKQTDEETIDVQKDGKHFGWVSLIYGESGWDVICDYTVNLEPFLVETMKLVEKLGR